jgi:hypothetical protein
MTATAIDVPAAISVAEKGLPSSELAIRMEKMLFVAGFEAYANLGVVYEYLRSQTPLSVVAPWFSETYEELKQLVVQHRVEQDVADSTFDHARRLMRAMPTAVPKPELAIEPDGHIVLEWQQAKRWVLVASVGSDSTIHFAGLFGANRYQGAEHFDRNLPKGLAENLGRYLSPPLNAGIVNGN